MHTEPARSVLPPLSIVRRPSSFRDRQNTRASRFPTSLVLMHRRSFCTPWTRKVQWRRLRRTTHWFSSWMSSRTSVRSSLLSRRCTTLTLSRLTRSLGMDLSADTYTMRSMILDSNYSVDPMDRRRPTCGWLLMWMLWTLLPQSLLLFKCVFLLLGHRWINIHDLKGKEETEIGVKKKKKKKKRKKKSSTNLIMRLNASAATDSERPRNVIKNRSKYHYQGLWL